MQSLRRKRTAGLGAAGRNGKGTTLADSSLPRMSTANSVPTAALPRSTYAMAIALASVGVKVPLVTLPMGLPPRVTRAPSRAIRLPNSRPTRTGSAASARRFSRAARPRKSPLSILTAHASPA